MTKIEVKLPSFICQCDYSIRVVYYFIGVVDLQLTRFYSALFSCFAQVVKIRQGTTRPWSPSFGDQFL